MRYLTPIPKQFVDQSGIPYSDGTVSVYLSGSDELADIFEAAEGDALCPNPCKLDSNGAWQCFVPGDVPLDYIVQDKHGNVVFPYYNIVPGSGSGSGAVFTVNGTEGEIKVTNRVTASGRREATVGLDTAFKQRIDQVEDDIGDLNEEMRGVEGSIQELGEDVDHLDDRVEEAEGQIDQLSESLAEKKDRQTPVVVGSIPANKTVKRISQDANGEIDVETQDIEFPDYSQRFDNIENEQIVDAKVIAAALNDLNVRMESVEDAQDEKNIGERIADAFDSQNLFERGVRVKVRQAAKSLDGATNKTVTNVSQDENGEITVTFSSISLSDYEKTANKKTSVTGNEGSNTYYPTIKALVDYLDSRLQNLGGKKITNNGVPFTTASQLPTTTPYYGQNINNDDYAYVQDTGLASRYTATVTGSSVAWSLDYEIALPVFTEEQQAAINSGANSTKIGNYDSHLENTDNPHGVTYSQVGASPDTHTHQVVINGVTKTIDKTGGTPVDLGTYLTSHQDLSNYLTKMGNGSDVTASFTAADSRNNISTGEKLSVIFGKIAKWFSDLKAVAFSGSYNDLSETPALGSLASKNNVSDSDINGTISDEHIASSSTWNNKQNAIEDLSDIRDGASKGETAVQPEDLVTYMTNPVEGKTIAASLNELNARLGSVEDTQGEKNIGNRTADSLDAQVLMVGGVPVKIQQTPKSLNGTTTKTVTNFSQDENGEFYAIFDDIAFPDWTSTINEAVAHCEKVDNKKNSLTGYESSTTAYPSIKAVVDFVNSALQNLGGKLITDNGDPFTDSLDLPNTTPYQGVDIADKDYAYIQNTGTAERWSATVSGTSVTWVQEYAISIPVFTPTQQAAIDSTVNSTKVRNYDSHVANGGVHVTPTEKTEWSGKQDALSTAQMDAVNSGITSGKVSGYDSHVENGDIHVTMAEKDAWNAKQDAIADLDTIRSGAASGATAVQHDELAPYMTNHVEGGVIAAALNDLNARLHAIECEDENIGDKIADKFDAQVLRCGSVDVKTKQAAKTSPFASGDALAFIDSMSQNENGEITATKKTVQSASVSQPGVVQLNSTVVSTSTSQAATPSAVKAAYDLANGKQDPIGIDSSGGDESLFLTQNGSWLPTPDEIVIIDDTYDVDSVLSLISAGKTPVYKYGANYLYNLEKYQESGQNRFVTFTQSRLDNIYVFGPSGLQEIKVTYIYQATVTTSGWSNDSYYTYGNESFVSSIATPYIDNAHFPTTKAVSDFVDQAISGVGGKQITDSGSPFTSSASLPSSTPYGGQNIASNDYAYVQQGYTVTRYVASVNGSSVTWSESFSIDASAFLTVPIGFTEAQTVENINANETLPTILGKIKKWFTDKISQLGNLAFLNQVGNAQISGAINDSHIASASTWNNKQNALPYSEGKYGISISGNADTATKATYDGAGNNIESMKAFRWDAYGATGTTYDSNYYLGTDAFMFNSNYYTIRFSQNSSHNLPISGDWLGYESAQDDAPPLMAGGWRECIVTIDLCLVYTSNVSEVVTVELVTSNGYAATAFCPRSAMRFITYSDGNQHEVNLHCEFTLRRDDKDISEHAYAAGRPCKPAIKRVTNNGTVTVSYWSISTSVM